MTSPVETITVRCPECRTEYDDWTRASVNLDLEGWDSEDPETAAYLRECSTATCPSCGHVVDLDVLTIERDVWTFSGAL